jgi:hypothetical protein
MRCFQRNELNDVDTATRKQFEAEFKECAMVTLSEVLGPVAKPVLSCMEHSATLNSPKELDAVFALPLGQTGNLT